ncbi:hypothetical protein J4731_22500 [Providencia rettgeri]|nr:hypothetical protein [Providencia rettgeri]
MRRCHKCGTLGYEEGIGSSVELFCTNGDCGERITRDNTRQVLQPAGFVTDAYDSVTNNIETMKYIPVVPAWVFVKAERCRYQTQRWVLWLQALTGMYSSRVWAKVDMVMHCA